MFERDIPLTTALILMALPVIGCSDDSPTSAGAAAGTTGGGAFSGTGGDGGSATNAAGGSGTSGTGTSGAGTSGTGGTGPSCCAVQEPGDAPVTGETFHVDRKHADCADSGPGSSTQPWCSLLPINAHAKPGDLVLIANGRYGEHFQPTVSGEPGKPITLRATGDQVIVGSFIDVDDASLVEEPGTTNVWRIELPADVTLDGVSVHQTHFDPIVVDDSNSSKFELREEDGPLFLTSSGIGSVADVSAIEGSFYLQGTTIWVHPLGHLTPSDAATDLVVGNRKFSFLISKDTSHLVVEGLTFRYSSSGSLSINGDFNTLRNIRTNVGIMITGDDNMVDGVTSTHYHSRTENGGYAWFTKGSGSGGSIQGHRNVVRRGHFFHNWNNMGSGGTDTLFDGLVIHGSPNHCWLPGETVDVTVRNLVEFNCQDYQYVNSPTGYTLENSTLPGGIMLQAYPLDSGNIVGPLVFRNNVFMGVEAVFRWVKQYPPKDCNFEAETIFENNIFYKHGNLGLTIEHCAGDPPTGTTYGLDEYLEKCEAGTLVGCAKFVNNQVIDGATPAESILAGGKWKPNTDDWDVHLVAGSPAVDQGASVDSDRDFEGTLVPRAPPSTSAPTNCARVDESAELRRPFRPLRSKRAASPRGARRCCSPRKPPGHSGARKFASHPKSRSRCNRRGSPRPSCTWRRRRARMVPPAPARTSGRETEP